MRFDVHMMNHVLGMRNSSPLSLTTISSASDGLKYSDSHCFHAAQEKENGGEAPALSHRIRTNKALSSADTSALDIEVKTHCSDGGAGAESPEEAIDSMVASDANNDSRERLSEEEDAAPYFCPSSDDLNFHYLQDDEFEIILLDRAMAVSEEMDSKANDSSLLGQDIEPEGTQERSSVKAQLEGLGEEPLNLSTGLRWSSFHTPFHLLQTGASLIPLNPSIMYQAPFVADQIEQSVLNQLRIHISQGSDGRYEIALSPEELGKIRIEIIAGESCAVRIWAERGNTRNLLQNCIADLKNVFGGNGVENVDISFEGSFGTGEGGKDGFKAWSYREESSDEMKGMRGSVEDNERRILISDNKIDVRL